MTIIDELLATWKTSDIDERLRIVCDQIAKEEIKDPDSYEGPIGANIFLSLPVEDMLVKLGNNKYENYICLEREAQNKYIISHWNCLANSTTSTPKRQKAWDVKNDDPKKILKEFVERIQHLKGE
jgi:hypothetical protein